MTTQEHIDYWRNLATSDRRGFQVARKSIPRGVLKDIKRLIKELDKDNIHVQRAILFGSQVLGRAHEHSDIDLALVSRDFSGSRFEDNERLAKATLRVNYMIETHPYTPEDFEDSPFVRDEILKHGIEIL